MASYRELLTLHSEEIRARAREQEISGRGSMSKIEKVAALAEEDLSGLVEVLGQRKSDLVEVAGDMGLDTVGTKDELQIRIADAQTTEIERDTYPDSSRDGSTRKPDPDLESSFETTERRREAIMKGTGRTVAAAWEKKTSFVLLESLLPRDRREPLTMQPSYIQHHPDEILVAEVIVRQAQAEARPPLPEDERVVTTGQEAASIALQDGESQVVIYHPSDKDQMSIQPSHRQRNRNSAVVLEVLVPHVAHRVHKAERNPLRIWQQDS